jgi:hypothetical protein
MGYVEITVVGLPAAGKWGAARREGVRHRVVHPGGTHGDVLVPKETFDDLDAPLGIYLDQRLVEILGLAEIVPVTLTPQGPHY